MSPKPRHGFTLIELAIVLVIVGLIIGGIIIGQDLIHAAQLRSIVSQFERYNTAISTFRMKYNCLPGDCPVASQFGLSDAACPAQYTCNQESPLSYTYAGCNGSGNSILDNFSNPALTVNYASCPENLNFWTHMSRANLIEGNYDGKSLRSAVTIGNSWIPVFGVSSPLTRLRNVGIYTNFGQAYVLGRENIFPTRGQLLITEAYWLDVKMNDGAPNTGRVRCVDALCTPLSLPNQYYLTAPSNTRVYLNIIMLPYFSSPFSIMD